MSDYKTESTVVKYVIKVVDDQFVASGKSDTDFLSEAMLFNDKKAAQAFITRHSIYCHGILAVKVHRQVVWGND